MRRPIPFTVVGGFLGSGKTTLLNRILTRPEAMHYAVLVNDFGALNIDAELLSDQHGKLVRLSNGCICCTIGDSLVSTLLSVLRTRPRPTRIVVEASGVADPAKIADFARLSPSLVLDRVIVLVDAEQVRSQCTDSYVGEMVEKQLVAADVLILNKRDLVSSAQWVSVSDWLLEKAPMATMLVAEQANVPLEDLLSTDQQLGGHQPSVAPAGRKKEPGSADHHRAHSASLRTWQFTSTTPLDRDKLQNLLASLPNSIVRMKGFVRFSDAPGKLQSLQRVGRRCSIVEHCAVGTEDQGTRLVVLGNIEMPDEDQLQSWFLSVLAN